MTRRTKEEESTVNGPSSSSDAGSSASVVVEEVVPVRKKKRTLGTFPCAHCDKVFTRSDHLARHNLNHEPKEVFKCDFVIDEFGGNTRICGKTFVRRDLKDRHTRRHLELQGVKYDISPNANSELRTPDQQSDDSSSDGTPIDKKKGYSPVIRSRMQSIHELPAPKGAQKNVLPNIQYHPGQAPPSIHDQMQYQQVRQSTLILPQPPQGGLRSSPGMPHMPQRMPSQGGIQASPPVIHGIQVSPQGIHGTQNSPPVIHGIQASPPVIHGIQASPQSIQGQNIQGQGIQGQGLLDQSPVGQGQGYQIPHQSEFTHPMGFTSFVPQSQNDILSWLFTESPPNMIKPKDTKKDFSSPFSETTDQRIPTLLSIQELQQQQVQNELQNHQPYQDPNLILNPPVLPAADPALSNAFGVPYDTSVYAAHMSNPIYGLQDINIFLNDDNPLDEVFLRNYQAQFLEGSRQFLNKEGIIPHLNSASLTSPSTTAESNLASPTVPYSPEGPTSNLEPLETKLINHGQSFNFPKHPHIFIDGLLLDLFIKVLPNVTRERIIDIFKHDDQVQKYVIEDRLSYYLHMYWLVFHTQFTILHKPSFNTKQAPPLLLLCMILIGCNYSSPTQNEILARSRKRSPELKFSMLIAVPLRFQIFQHEDFKLPVKLWILQSLNMLEWSEKNFLPRGMHERGHVHHGTTVQLLRRSPLLGGNPAALNKKVGSTSGSNTSAGEEDSDAAASVDTNPGDTSDYDLFVKWVEAELMKRVTFMTFYLDIIDYIKFRHNPQINFYQLQLLNLPCDDEQLWESKEVNGSFRKIFRSQKKLQQQRKLQQHDKTSGIRIKNGESFLNVLKKLLKPNKSVDAWSKMKLSVFTRKVLLAGLVSIMYQMQQTELQNNSSLLTSNGIIQSNNQRSKIWKEILTRAFDNWNADLIESYSTLVLTPSTSSVFNDISTVQVPIPMYHLSQIIGISDINHYDIAIFGGSPANMSVSATLKDHYNVQRKLNNMWLKLSPPSKRTIHELINLRTVIHCYLLLWQLMLKPLDDGMENALYLNWNVNRDYFDSMYAISIATLVLWCFSFSTCGLESHRFDELDQNDTELSYKAYEDLIQLSAEGGYQYLSRVRQEFLTNLRKDNLHKEFNIHPFKLSHTQNGKPVNYSPHEILTKYCDILPNISNKQNLSGLCFLVGTKLLKSQWEVIRENAKLILNCGYRSIGKKDILCRDLFENELEE